MVSVNGEVDMRACVWYDIVGVGVVGYYLPRSLTNNTTEDRENDLP